MLSKNESINTNMLSKEDCSLAIKTWDDTRSHYSKIKNLIQPATAFHFPKVDCIWLNENNNNKEFHTYIGVHKEFLILISVPIDEEGQEVDLDFYLAIPLKPLEKSINLIDEKKYTTIDKTTLSKKLEIISSTEKIEFPIINEPKMKERASVEDIIEWKNSYLDWFYKECTNYGGNGIFKTFSVPFSDLVNDDGKYNQVICLFAFKNSKVYNRLVPVLIFVAVDEETLDAKIIRNINDPIDDDTDTNSADWSQPCPPFCKDDLDYKIFE